MPPPVNTPARSPPSPQTPTYTSSGRPLTPLSYLSSPAPDLASTLIHTSRAADEADAANANFLRDSLESLDHASTTQQQQQHRQHQQQQQRRSLIDPQRDPRRSAAENHQSESSRRQQQSQQHQDTTTTTSSSSSSAEDLSRRERLQRVLARLNRLHDPAAPTSSTGAASYSNRTPSPSRQSLYDWAPAPARAEGEGDRTMEEEEEEEEEGEEGEVEAILRALRTQQPDAQADVLRVWGESLGGGERQREREGSGNGNGNGNGDGDGGGVAGPAARMNEAAESAERRNRLRERERRSRDSEWVSLRSRAALQRVRQEDAGSPSARERMLRYVMDRERSGLSEEEERARGTGWLRPSPTRGGNSNEDNGRGANWTRDSWLLPPPANEWRERDRQERVEAFRRGYLAENVPPRLPRVSTPAPPAASSPAPPSSTSSSPLLESALKYLSELRSCTRYEEALSAAITHGLATKEFFADKHDDFVMDLDDIPPLPYSSWLQPGTVFEGHQHATSPSNANLTHQRSTSSSHIEQINPNYRSSNALTTGFDHPPGSTRVAPFSQFHSQLTPSTTAKEPPPHDHWPVRVTIHSVDPEAMTLQGTMEAYDVPQHPSSSLSIINNAASTTSTAGTAGTASADWPKAGKKSKPITTYLEGEIIDLRTHSFLTPGAGDRKKEGGGASATGSQENTTSARVTDSIAFPSANSATDAQDWLRLPPFNNTTNNNTSTHPTVPSSSSSSSAKSTAHTLLTTPLLSSLQEEYIFMRWKERCFIHSPHNDPCPSSPRQRAGDQDRGHGLTISGFYYVSLRRADGVVEGLYFDPGSTPVQGLRLRGRGVVWGGWGFR